MRFTEVNGGRIRHRRVYKLDGQEVAYQDASRGVELRRCSPKSE